MAVPPTLPRLPRPVAPVAVPTGGSLDQRLNLLADSVSRKAEINTAPAFIAVILAAPNGTQFRITVDNNGQLVTENVAVRG